MQPQNPPQPKREISDTRAALVAIVLLFATAPFTVAAWLFGWGLTGVAWNYAARMWGG